jgi:transcriptional regulator with XRE-family HTH domain
MTKEEQLRRDFGLRLKAARERVGLTQQAVAERFDVKKGTVSAWENGAGLPDALRLRQLAKLYNVSADALLWAESLTPDAMRIAAGYDDLTGAQKMKFDAMWVGFYAATAPEELVRQTYKPNVEGNTTIPGELDEMSPDRAHHSDEALGGISRVGDLGAPEEPKKPQRRGHK